MAEALTVLAPGTLVQVKEKCVAEGSEWEVFNARLVEGHGWLWLIVSVDELGRDEGVLYNCRSLATGEINHLFDYEINVMEASDG